MLFEPTRDGAFSPVIGTGRHAAALERGVPRFPMQESHSVHGEPVSGVAL